MFSDVTFKFGDDMPANNITAIAKWEARTYTITFKTDDGTQIVAQTYKYGEKTVAPNNPTRNGYNFTGWTFSDVTFKFGDDMPSQNIIASAEWTYKTVEYDSGKEDLKVDNKKWYFYDVMDISELSRFFNSDYIIEFRIKISMKEEDNGIQKIHLLRRDETTVTDNPIKIEYGGNKALKEYSLVELEPIIVSGENLTDYMIIRYSAEKSSWLDVSADTWYRGQVTATVIVHDKPKQ